MSAPPPEAGGAAPAGFRPLHEVERYGGGRIRLVEATFEAPDGTTFTRDVVRHPGAVAVVPLTDRGTVLLVRQYRGAVDRELLEIPAGTRDVEGEPPETTAARELTEEVGVRAGRVELLGRMYNSPGFCDELTYLFVASDLEPADTARTGVEEHHMQVVEVDLADVDLMMRDGRLVDAQTVLGLLMVRARAAPVGPVGPVGPAAAGGGGAGGGGVGDAAADPGGAS